MDSSQLNCLDFMRFIDQVAIITGAGSGIGKATAFKLAREGAKVVIADISDIHGSQTLKELSELKYEAIFIKTDIALEEDIKKLINETLRVFKKIDVIVNNAAIMTFAPVTEIKVEDWNRVMKTNLGSVFLMTKFALPHMSGGAIVNLSSVHAHETTPNNSAYAASKGGIEAFTRAISLELNPEQVRINCVAPGAVNTPMLWNNPNIKNGKEKIIGKIADPDEVAAAIVFLASKEASFIHGTTLVVDGGRLAVL